jgi:hypothetical protein
MRLYITIDARERHSPSLGGARITIVGSFPAMTIYWLRVSSRLGSTDKVLKMWNSGTIA